MTRPTSMKRRGDDDDDDAFDSTLRKIAHVSLMSADPPLPRVGQVIGEKYRIEARLGRGGMGVVYRATHLVSRKAVAVKWMLRPATNGSAHRRLVREALAAGRIDHPNVVNVYDVGQEGACAFLVMELLHGESLRARLERGRLESTEAIDLLLPALRGVSAAHRAGVIHRDLKPDNIFLCTDPGGAAREAKVLDFGVSAVVVPQALHPTLTDNATILGTPAYMSPEQLASSQDADERTDVYAFGVMLYEALTGRLPFVAEGYSGLVLAVARELPTAPSKVCAGIPGQLERVILQALSKERRERPQTMDCLHDLLAPFGSARRHPSDGAGAPAVQHPPELRRPRRSPGRATLAAPMRRVVLGAAGGCLLLGALGWLAAREGEDAARAPRAETFTPVGANLGASPAPPDLPLPSAPSGPNVRPLLQPASALRQAPPSDDALDDWAPAEPSRGVPERPRSRPRRERARSEARARSERGVDAPSPENVRRRGLDEAYETR